MSLVMESATAMCCDSDAPASLPGYNTTEHHDAVLVRVSAGLAEVSGAQEEKGS